MISPGLNLRHLHRQHVSIDSERQASLQVSASRTTHSGHMPLPVWHLSSRVDRSHFHDADGRYMPLEMLRLTVGLTADGVDRLDCKPPAAQVTRCSSQCGDEKGAGQPDLPKSRACLNSRRPMPERRYTRRHSASSSWVRSFTRRSSQTSRSRPCRCISPACCVNMTTPEDAVHGSTAGGAHSSHSF